MDEEPVPESQQPPEATEGDEAGAAEGQEPHGEEMDEPSTVPVEAGGGDAAAEEEQQDTQQPQQQEEEEEGQGGAEGVGEVQQPPEGEEPQVDEDTMEREQPHEDFPVAEQPADEAEQPAEPAPHEAEMEPVSDIPRPHETDVVEHGAEGMPETFEGEGPVDEGLPRPADQEIAGVGEGAGEAVAEAEREQPHHVEREADEEREAPPPPLEDSALAYAEAEQTVEDILRAAGGEKEDVEPYGEAEREDAAEREMGQLEEGQEIGHGEEEDAYAEATAAEAEPTQDEGVEATPFVRAPHDEEDVEAEEAEDREPPPEEEEAEEHLASAPHQDAAPLLDDSVGEESPTARTEGPSALETAQEMLEEAGQDRSPSSYGASLLPPPGVVPADSPRTAARKAVKFGEESPSSAAEPAEVVAVDPFRAIVSVSTVDAESKERSSVVISIPQRAITDAHSSSASSGRPSRSLSQSSQLSMYLQGGYRHVKFSRVQLATTFIVLVSIILWTSIFDGAVVLEKDARTTIDTLTKLMQGIGDFLLLACFTQLVFYINLWKEGAPPPPWALLGVALALVVAYGAVSIGLSIAMSDFPLYQPSLLAVTLPLLMAVYFFWAHQVYPNRAKKHLQQRCIFVAIFLIPGVGGFCALRGLEGTIIGALDPGEDVSVSDLSGMSGNVWVGLFFLTLWMVLGAYTWSGKSMGRLRDPTPLFLLPFIVIAVTPILLGEIYTLGVDLLVDRLPGFRKHDWFIMERRDTTFSGYFFLTFVLFIILQAILRSGLNRLSRRSLFMRKVAATVGVGVTYFGDLLLAMWVVCSPPVALAIDVDVDPRVSTDPSAVEAERPPVTEVSVRPSAAFWVLSFAILIRNIIRDGCLGDDIGETSLAGWNTCRMNNYFCPPMPMLTRTCFGFCDATVRPQGRWGQFLSRMRSAFGWFGAYDTDEDRRMDHFHIAQAHILAQHAMAIFPVVLVTLETWLCYGGDANSKFRTPMLHLVNLMAAPPTTTTDDGDDVLLRNDCRKVDAEGWRVQEDLRRFAVLQGVIFMVLVYVGLILVRMIQTRKMRGSAVIMPAEWRGGGFFGQNLDDAQDPYGASFASSSDSSPSAARPTAWGQDAVTFGRQDSGRSHMNFVEQLDDSARQLMIDRPQLFLLLAIAVWATYQAMAIMYDTNLRIAGEMDLPTIPSQCISTTVP
ncbi:unnamed protein product [Vitrella brassicaformis CCMP3155]|uniref:Uncharacterized protein n=4 Tax=Vitrella brassicaformis TaxID=1169539 RepID=A0A0G4EM10_VITBC|nr:unnamed protein product [Vitrella brassicaformis CCMP3155]|eukprot:CEL98465.1 unnamed protein product [Vitrella brassicaformis CCMP3155]